MSFRMIAHRLFKHGRLFVHSYFKRDIHLNIFENNNKKNISANLRKGGQQIIAQQQHVIKNFGLIRFGQHARRLFVDNILNRVTTTYSADLRSEATKKFLYGDSSPFFALVGVSLASGNGILTKDDELEGVCYEIREAVSRLQNKWYNKEFPLNDDSSKQKRFNIDDLNIGPPIAKGCSAVVYATNLKVSEENNIVNNVLNKKNKNDTITTTTNTPLSSPAKFSRQTEEMMSPIQHTSRFLHNFGGSVDNLYFNNQSLIYDADESNELLTHQRQRFESISEQGENDTNNTTNNNNVTEKCDSNNNLNSLSIGTTISKDINLFEYPLALKMMFNYDIQSNAASILRAMYKETIPARNKYVNEDVDNWEKILQEQSMKLPPHPNIVAMFGVFCAQIPNLQQSNNLYPMALPQRLNPNGYGRNMSLFLLMKRYNCSLNEYLQLENITMRTRLLLFTQLLEAIVHLYRYGVSHRDLKSDNILIDLNDDIQPVLVISDFGCCLADKVNGFQLPYQTENVDKGGNTALMAPEIITKTPGTFSILNYTKSDIWACGTIAYEIFGQKNPFYMNSYNNDDGVDNNLKSNKTLKNYDYNEMDLPQLNNNVPIIVRKLIENILQKNPNKRLSPDIAANVMQLYLWAPSKWFRLDEKPTSGEILQWLLSLTTKVLCEQKIGNGFGDAAGGSNNNRNTDTNKNNNDRKYTDGVDSFGYKMGRRTYTEYLLISSFLIRARLERIRNALNWIQNIN